MVTYTTGEELDGSCQEAASRHAGLLYHQKRAGQAVAKYPVVVATIEEELDGPCQGKWLQPPPRAELESKPAERPGISTYPRGEKTMQAEAALAYGRDPRRGNDGREPEVAR